MMKSVVLAASTLALVAGMSAARADGAVPPGTAKAIEHYYVTTCADYLAHSDADRAEVINWMTNYQVEGKSPRGHTRQQRTDSWFAGTTLDQVNATCSGDPHLLFGEVLQQRHINAG